jgi:hypothetical protein
MIRAVSDNPGAAPSWENSGNIGEHPTGSSAKFEDDLLMVLVCVSDTGERFILEPIQHGRREETA